jgi:hypothetical protein
MVGLIGALSPTPVPCLRTASFGDKDPLLSDVNIEGRVGLGGRWDASNNEFGCNCGKLVDFGLFEPLTDFVKFDSDTETRFSDFVDRSTSENSDATGDLTEEVFLKRLSVLLFLLFTCCR